MLMIPVFILLLIIMVIYDGKCREKRNRVHFYVTRDKVSTIAWLYLGKPIRNRVDECWIPKHRAICNEYFFRYIGINENKYKDLKWEDEPLEVFLNLED